MLEHLISIAPTIIAILALSVAFRQSSISQNKLRLDLYNRRFMILENTLIFCQELNGGFASLEKVGFSDIHRSFITSCRESQFLFKSDSGIYELLTEIHEKSFDVISLVCMQKDERTRKDKLHGGMVIRFLDAQKFVYEKLPILEKKLVPYLNFQKVLA